MKRFTTLLLAVLLLLTVLLAGGCSGKMNLLTGRWKLVTQGDAYGGNQQQPSLPIAVWIDIYPDGTIDLFDDPFGKWTMDRDTFTFKSDDGEIDTYGSFQLGTTTDEQTGANVPTLTVYTQDDNPVSYVLQKVANLGPLESMKRSTATAAP